MKLLRDTCREHKIICNPDQVFAYLSEFEEKEKVEQMNLFDLL